MRIRDWSSYMYSSDLQAPTRRWQTPCRSYDFPQNGAHRAGIGANAAGRELDQFVPPGQHVIEHEPLQYPHIDRLDRLMRIERLRLFGVGRGGVGADQAHAHRTKPRDDIASDRGEIRVPLLVRELLIGPQQDALRVLDRIPINIADLDPPARMAPIDQHAPPDLALEVAIGARTIVG